MKSEEEGRKRQNILVGPKEGGLESGEEGQI